MPEVLDERSRKARDHAVIGGKAFAGVGSRIAAGKRYPLVSRTVSAILELFTSPDGNAKTAPRCQVKPINPLPLRSRGYWWA
jgi:hypothetical protein